ncbi:MAG: hypothetical protein AAF597_20175, partial [Bacteroidota bacterium]
WKSVEPTLYYVGAAVSFFGSLQSSSEHLKSDDGLLQATGIFEAVSALTVGEAAVDRVARAKINRDAASAARASALYYGGNSAVPGYLGAQTSRFLPVVSWGASGVVDLLMCAHHLSKVPPEYARAASHALSCAGSAVMLFTELGLIGLSGATVGPFLLLSGIGIAAVEGLHSLYDSSYLSGYSKTLKRMLSDGGTEAGYYYRRLASPELRRKFELIHRQVGQIQKRDPSDAARRWLRTCGVDYELWPLLMNVEPVPRDDPRYT